MSHLPPEQIASQLIEAVRQLNRKKIGIHSKEDIENREFEIRALKLDLLRALKRELGFDEKDLYEKLLAAVKEHHDQKADDRCIEDDAKLYQAAGFPMHDCRVGDKGAMLKNCSRFIENRCAEGGWPSYVELEAKIKELEKWKANYTPAMLEYVNACRHMKDLCVDFAILQVVVKRLLDLPRYDSLSPQFLEVFGILHETLDEIKEHRKRNYPSQNLSQLGEGKDPIKSRGN